MSVGGGSGAKATSLCPNPDGSIVAAAAADGTMGLWDTNTAEQIVAYAADGTSCSAGPREATKGKAQNGAKGVVAFQPDGMLLVHGRGKDARLWDVRQAAPVGVLDGLAVRFVFSLSLSLSLSLFVSFRFVSLPFASLCLPVRSFLFFSQSRLIWVSFPFLSISPLLATLWCAASSPPLCPSLAHYRFCSLRMFSIEPATPCRAGVLAAFGDDSNALTIFDLRKMNAKAVPVAKSSDLGSPVLSVDFDFSGAFVAAGTAAGSISVTHVKKWAQAAALEEASGKAICGLAFSKDQPGSFIAAASMDKTLAFYAVA